jgi:hypothetical protein
LLRDFGRILKLLNVLFNDPIEFYAISEFRRKV